MSGPGVIMSDFKPGVSLMATVGGLERESSYRADDLGVGEQG